MKDQPEHSLLLKWLILTGLIAFAVIVAWHEDVITLLYSVDTSRISWVITLIYILVTMHCARRIYIISTQTNLSKKVDDIIKNEDKLGFNVSDEQITINSDKKLPDCFMTEYIKDLYYLNKDKLDSEESSSPTDLIEVYESRLKGPQEIGWFVSDMMLKLGLLGTIIGFIFMLGSVANIADFDVSNMQKILRHMSNGMGTALYTTLTGLTCSILSAMQYHMLDRHADELVELIRHLTQVHVIPKFK
ncbi:MAG: MotA/TolQ/ExbB proton channel family protein [Proteobacteria bacterium]|nr:MotA/TolQ/ExbB proton channel family protein [Pseudomonadota bacterium]